MVGAELRFYLVHNDQSPFARLQLGDDLFGLTRALPMRKHRVSGNYNPANMLPIEYVS